MPLMHATAHARVLTLSVLAHNDPVEVFGLAALERRVDAGKNARRAHVGVLVEPLANLQPQTPQRDVVRDMRVAGGAEQNRVLGAQSIESVVGHHRPMWAKLVPAPVEVFEFEAKTASGERFQNLPSRGHNFLADTIAGHGGDPIGLHDFAPYQDEESELTR